jgi:hypothetical protein
MLNNDTGDTDLKKTSTRITEKMRRTARPQAQRKQPLRR